MHDEIKTNLYADDSYYSIKMYSIIFNWQLSIKS